MAAKKKSRTFQYETHVKTIGPVRCHWCAVECEHPQNYSTDGMQATKDHVQPKSKFRVFGRSGMVWACQTCNQVKGNLTALQWGVFMKHFGSYKEFYRQPWLDKLRREFVSTMKGVGKNV